MDDKKVRFAFLGGLYPDDSRHLQADSKVSLDYAADAYQKKYLTAFREIGIENMRIFSRLFLGSWPFNHTKKYIAYRGDSSFGEVTYIDYLNVLGLRDFSQRRRTVQEVKRWYRALGKEETGVLFVYSASFSSEIITLRKVCPELKICMIVPDLPQFTYLSDNSFLRRCIVASRQKQFEKSCRYVDRCICITKQMSELVEEKTGALCSTMEAIADKQRCEEGLRRLEADDASQTGEEIVKILYTGTLAKRYGILTLLEAFEELTEKPCELIICGGGDAEAEVTAHAKRDTRIRFLGIVSNKDAKELQSQADILVNPRKPTDEFTAFSFPSKTMEYLETGNMVVCYPLPGIPEEYRDLICPAEGDGTAALAEALKRCIRMTRTERIACGKKNLRFLLEHKCGVLLAEIVEDLVTEQ